MELEAYGHDKISIHALREEGDIDAEGKCYTVLISIHALREEGDSHSSQWASTLSNFYPRPPRGGRHLAELQNIMMRAISIHALREEGDGRYPRLYRGTAISIHALREEGDQLRQQKQQRPKNISIHALREEGDTNAIYTKKTKKISIHALREEGDVTGTAEKPAPYISIHALREEGDSLLRISTSMLLAFLSTPSARRATNGHRHYQELEKNFYPRPPRGGRPHGHLLF